MPAKKQAKLSCAQVIAHGCSGRDATVLQVNYAPGLGTDSRVVCRNDNGQPFLLVEPLKDLYDLLGILRVQMSRGLVGQQELRARHQCAGYCDALLLAARQLFRQVVNAMSESDLFERLLSVSLA